MGREDGARPAGVVVECAYITPIGKYRPADHPKELRAVFGVKLYFDISGLIGDKSVLIGIADCIAARTQSTCAEGSDIIRPTGKKGFYIGQTGAVAVGNTDT